WPWRTRTSVPVMGFSCDLYVKEMLSKPEHVAHRIKAGLARSRPQRGLYRAAREQRAVAGEVGKHDALARAGKDDRVLADHGTAAQCGEADRALLARAGVAVAHAHASFRQRHGAALGRRLAQKQRGAGGRIDLVAMVHL